MRFRVLRRQHHYYGYRIALEVIFGISTVEFEYVHVIEKKDQVKR